MDERLFIEIPAEIRPRLARGRLHALRITAAHVELSSYASLYGNKTSETLLTIPGADILDVQYNAPRFPAIKRFGHVTYRDAQGQEKQLRYSAATSTGYFNNELTKIVTEALEALCWQKGELPLAPLVVPLQPPGSARKFLVGLFLFASTVLFAAVTLGLYILFFFGAFLFFPSLIALGIDYIRLNKAWATPVKIITYAAIFLVGLILMVTMFMIFDHYRVFQR